MYRKKKAHEIVHDVCQQAVKYDICCFYKKTDSALRGNVGSELQAAADAVLEKISCLFRLFRQCEESPLTVFII
ncbi:MAG: four-carbon acid sugar kinase family protein [Coprococcus sp.]